MPFTPSSFLSNYKYFLSFFSWTHALWCKRQQLHVWDALENDATIETCRANLKNITPWSTGLLETLTVSLLVKKFPAFYGTWRLITAITKARHLSLSWAFIGGIRPCGWLSVVSVTPQTLREHSKASRWPLNRQLCACQGRCNRYGEEKNPSPHEESN
jgi:hypothetical protein